MTGPLGPEGSEAKIRDFLEFLLRNSPPCQRVAEQDKSRLLRQLSGRRRSGER
jgi:hypothetical protein